MDAKASGAKLIVFDTRLSNTATHADFWVAPYPGSEPAIVLSIANYLIRGGLYNREFVRRWWNWEEYMAVERPELETTFDEFERVLRELYSAYTFEFAAAESGVDAGTIEEIARVVSTAGTRFSSHNWRSAGAGNSGGWQVARTLFLLNALLFMLVGLQLPVILDGLAGYSAASLVGYAALHKVPVLVNDVSKDPRYINAVPDAQSELVVPLLTPVLFALVIAPALAVRLAARRLPGPRE